MTATPEVTKEITRIETKGCWNLKKALYYNEAKELRSIIVVDERATNTLLRNDVKMKAVRY